jgi:hypothetical protein
MKIKTDALNTHESFKPWFAKQDAERLNAKWRPTYTLKQQAEAQKAVDLLDTAYSAKGIHINFRKKFIAVKVDRPIKRDKLFAATAEALFAEKGYTKAISAQGIIYRIPR